MNNYLVLDGLKYRAEAATWKPLLHKPATVRYNLDGTTDVTYGPTAPFEWFGRLIAPVTPDGEDWGDIDDLEEAIATIGAVSFQDHYGDSYNVHAIGPFSKTSRSSMWDGSSNEWLVEVRLVRA